MKDSFDIPFDFFFVFLFIFNLFLEFSPVVHVNQEIGLIPLNCQSKDLFLALFRHRTLKAILARVINSRHETLPIFEVQPWDREPDGGCWQLFGHFFLPFIVCLLRLEDVYSAVPLEAIVTAHFHLVTDIVHVEVRGESIGDAVDSVLDHELFLLLDVLLSVILRHRSSHVVAHQEHLIQLLHVPAPFLHLQQCERSQAGSPLPVAVPNIRDIPTHLPSLPMRPWCSFLLLFHELSHMGVVPDSSMAVVLERFFELVDESFMADHWYNIFLNSSHIFQLFS